MLRKLVRLSIFYFKNRSEAHFIIDVNPALRAILLIGGHELKFMSSFLGEKSPDCGYAGIQQSRTVNLFFRKFKIVN